MLVVNDNIDFEKYHLYPNVGLLNDPNGLVYFKGRQITSLIRTSPESFNGSLLMMYF